MTEPLQVGQFAIVDTEPVDRGPNAGFFHGKGPADDRADLYIVAEGTTPAGEAFAGHVVSALGHQWSAIDMSLTGALRRVFTEAERNLTDWNRKSIAQHRVSIGLTCFGRRGPQAVIAQAGPSAAFHLSGSTVTPYFTDEQHGRPIGIGAPVDPQLTRIDFKEGDRLLLITTPALRELDDDLIGGILQLPLEKVLPNLFRRLEHLRQVTVMLVTAPEQAHHGSAPFRIEDDEYVIDATGGAIPSLPAPQAGSEQTAEPGEHHEDDGYQPALFIGDPETAVAVRQRIELAAVTPRSITTAAPVPSMAIEMPAPLRRAAGDNPLASIAAERQARIVLAQTQAAMASGGGNGHGNLPNWRTSPVSPDTAPPAERRRSRRGSFSRGLVHEEAAPRPEPVIESVPLVGELAADRRAHAHLGAPISDTIAAEGTAAFNSGGSLVRVRDNMGGRWKGGGGIGGGRRTINSNQLPPTWLVIVVGLGILLGLVGFLVVPGMLREKDGERYAQLVEGAEKMLVTAQVQQDPAERRKALTEAHALLLEAQEADGEGAAAAALIDQVQGAINAMDAIQAPQGVDTIADLTQFGEKAVAATRLTIGGGMGYILDNGSHQVIGVTLETGEKKVAYAENKDAKQARPVGTAFLEQSPVGNRQLIIIDADKQLWAYDPSPNAGLRQIAFNPPQGLTVTDIAVYGRDLYVLDASDSVIYRFGPADGGFAAPASKVLSTPDLAAARRLMVNGEFVTADANGDLRWFSGQVALVLSEAGIDRKLTAPEPPQEMGGNEIAVLDTQADRVVVFSLDGTFLRQYKHKDFQGISAFATYDGHGYVFAGGKLRRVTW